MIDSSKRRRLIGAAAGAVALAQVPRAFAQQGYPSRNIRVVVPTAQGGSADRLARVFDDFAGTVAPDWRQVAVAGRFGRDE